MSKKDDMKKAAKKLLKSADTALQAAKDSDEKVEVSAAALALKAAVDTDDTMDNLDAKGEALSAALEKLTGSAPDGEKDLEDAEAEEDDEEDGDNEQVKGVTAAHLAAGGITRKARVMPKQAPPIPEGMKPILMSPRPFGVWIKDEHGDPHLHRFKKGRTPLTKEQHDGLHLDSYTRDNGASIVYK